MKFVSKLWMLAVAMATVGCSDDIENGPNNGTTNGEDGPTTYLKVEINSEIATRVTGGEDGDTPSDGDLVEGLANERNVNDVTIVLFTNQDGSAVDATNPSFTENSAICAVGWAPVTSQGEGPLEDHYWQATVEVPTSNASTGTITGKSLGVIAITNLGGSEDSPNSLYTAIKEGEIKSGKDLAENLQGEYILNNNFIMSTHTLGGGTGLPASTITLQETVSEDNIPSVSVYVERLAAKVRIKKQDGVTNFFYTVGETASPRAYVALTDVAIVNQLSSNSYLLKKVTSASATPSVSDAATYLADEVWVNNSSYNYVIDPYTSGKTVANVNSLPEGLTYLNRYAKPSTEDGDGIMTLDAAWTSYTGTGEGGTTKLTDAKMDDGDGLRLDYTMENTTSAENSLQGYSTGALFKAYYYPVQWSAYSSTTDKVAPEDVTYTSSPSASNIVAGKDFYEYKNAIYKDRVSVFAQCIFDAKGKDYSYADFDYTNNDEMTVAKFQSDYASIPEPFGYIDYVSTTIASEADDTKLSEIENLQTFEEYVTTDKTYGTGDATATFFDDGVCYYVYWIRHAGQQDHNMQPMEFAIVRNNIYDLTVATINGLGMSGTTVPDPTDPDEDENLRMRVVLNVKNWVVRNNSGITL